MIQYTQEDIELAAQWCLDAHKCQVDKAGNPYFMHPFAVMQSCTEPAEKIVALLHDVLEDSEVISPLDILNQFGQEVFDGVVAMTRGKGESYRDFIKRVSQNPIAKEVKKSDICHNLQDRGFRIPDSLRKRYMDALSFLTGSTF